MHMFFSVQILAPLCFCDDADGAGGKDDVGCKKILAAITKVGEEKQMERFLPVVNGIVKTDSPELQVSYIFKFIFLALRVDLWSLYFKIELIYFNLIMLMSTILSIFSVVFSLA